MGLVGEIYTLIEPYVNLNIEKKLGQLGVEVYRSLTLHEWVKIIYPLILNIDGA
jgi:transposase-like protein